MLLLYVVVELGQERDGDLLPFQQRARARQYRLALRVLLRPTMRAGGGEQRADEAGTGEPGRAIGATLSMTPVLSLSWAVAAIAGAPAIAVSQVAGRLHEHMWFRHHLPQLGVVRVR